VRIKPRAAFTAFLAVLIFDLFNLSVVAQTPAWQHPGVLVSQAQLDFVKQQVNNQVQPFYQEYIKAQKSNYGSLTYKPEGPYTGGIIQCGSYSNPNDGCQSADDDSAAAYVQALLWYISDNPIYADNAIAIMNAYGSGLKGYAGTTATPCPGAASTCENGPLQAAWDATKWPRAAEIIRYGNGGSAGWTPAAIANFSNMLETIYKPILYNGSDDNGNWELTMIEGMMGIAVFNEDLPLLQHAQLFWNQRVPAYFYDYAFDNPLYPGTHWPFPQRPGTAKPTWNGQLVFAADTTGVAQETCRDLKHTEDGIASTINAAETDYIQSQGGYGVNLYTDSSIDAQNRLVTSLNLMAGLESAHSTTAPPDFCTGSSDKITLGIGTTYAIGYNEYHNRLHDPNMADATSGTTGLLGTANTYTWIQNGLLPQSLYSDGGVHMAIFEPLTHYANAPSGPNFSLSLAPTSQTINVGASASYTVTMNPSAGYSGVDVLSVSGLPSGATANFNPASVSIGSATSTLTVTTGSSTPSGTYALVVSGTDGTLTNNTPATLTMSAPPESTVITITATNQTITYGDSIPKPKYTKSPSISLSTDAACVDSATTASLPNGSTGYPITCSGAVKAGYTFVYVPGTLTINPLSVTIEAKSQHMKVGEAVPALTYEVKPSSATLTTQPTCGTTPPATSSSPVGTYVINCSGAVGAGYTFVYDPANLTIEN
jgi:MBG domain (YGX type)